MNNYSPLCVCNIYYLQTALATSVGLRCLLVLVRTTNGKITLNLPDLIDDSAFQKEWSVESVVCASERRQQPNQTEAMKLQILKELSCIDEKNTPPIIELALQAFYYLLIEIYNEKLK